MSKLSFVAFALTVATLAASGSTNAHAQGAYPDRQIRIVVPVAPGGLADMLARAVGQQLGQELKQQVLIENKPGGNFQIGIKEVLAAPADGYTLLMGNNSTHGVNQAFNPKLPYDTLADFTPISIIADGREVLLTGPSLAARTVQELIALAKQQPGKISYASSGAGGQQHLSMEMLKSMADVNIAHIPYKGFGQGINDVMAGHVDMYFATALESIGSIKTGKLRGLAISTITKSPALPEMPTIAEAALPGFDTGSWIGMVAPAGTPPNVALTYLNQRRAIINIAVAF